MDEESGAFVEPVAVGVQACARAGLRAAATVAVIGAGPIGLVTMLVARAFGAASVFIVDRIPSRLALAATLGASATIEPSDAPDHIAQLTGGLGADFVFDASGSSAACALAPVLAARGGSITIIGWPEKSAFPYPIESVIEKELDVHGVNRYCNAFPRAIALLGTAALMSARSSPTVSRLTGCPRPSHSQLITQRKRSRSWCGPLRDRLTAILAKVD